MRINIKRLILVFSLIVIAINFGGCAKTLNPAGNSNFSCPATDNGVCASVQDVYKNRQDIEGYKKEQQYKELPDLEEYIERECGVEKFLDDKAAYRMCKKKAKEKYEKLVKEKHNKESGNTRYPGIDNNDFLKGVVKAKEGIPIRQPEKVTRIWIAPYENDMGDLVYSHFIYIVEDESNWVFTSENDAAEIRNSANPVSGGE